MQRRTSSNNTQGLLKDLRRKTERRGIRIIRIKEINFVLAAVSQRIKVPFLCLSVLDISLQPMLYKASYNRNE
jgi:hypothetical protein